MKIHLITLMILIACLTSCDNQKLEPSDQVEPSDTIVEAYTNGLYLNNAFWRVTKSQSGCMGLCWVGDYYTAGDSVVNEVVYTEIRLKKKDRDYPDKIIDEHIALVRNEGHKVLLLNSSGAEGVLYDFDMKVGDTTMWYGDEAVVESMEEFIFGNDTLKQYNLKTIQDQEGIEKGDFSIIEGIGSTNGLFQGVSFSSVNADASGLECFSVGERAYKRSSSCKKFDFSEYWFD